MNPVPSTALSGEAQPGVHEPVRILEVELSGVIPDIPPAVSGDGTPYPCASVLIRLHAVPLGLMRVALEDGALPAGQLCRHVWSALEAQINRHLREDGLPEVHELPVTGLAVAGTPQCRAVRARALAAAPLVSVIVCTRDRPEPLRTALLSLLGQDYPNIEIFVVDNAPSSTATWELLGQEPFRHRVRYIREDQPGKSAALNRGLRSAGGSLIALTDDDVRVDARWVSALVAGFQSDPRTSCIKGLTLPLELETPAQLLFERHGGFTCGFQPQMYDLDQHRPSDPLFPYTVGRFGGGVNMAFRASVLAELGGFDTALGGGTPAGGGEDLAALLGVIERGHRLAYQPEALVWHAHRREYTALKRQLYTYGSGLTAYLTKCVVDRPARLLEFARRAPLAAAYLFNGHSPKNRQKGRQFPRELTRIELLGMLYGPLAYLSRRLRGTPPSGRPGTARPSREPVG